MDLEQPQVDHGDPQNEQCCPNASSEAQEAAQAASLGEEEPSAGAQSHDPSLQSSCSLPGPSSALGAARPLSGPGSAPEPGEGTWTSEEEQSEVCHPLEPCRGEYHMEQELSQEEVNRNLKASQEENDSNKTSRHESWRRITIRTLWVNPGYPQLLRDPLQERAKAATPPASEEQVPAAGAQSPAPASPGCPPCSSRTRLAAPALGVQQGVHRQPSSPRRALQTLCTLLWCSCMELQLDG